MNLDIVDILIHSLSMIFFSHLGFDVNFIENWCNKECAKVLLLIWGPVTNPTN